MAVRNIGVTAGMWVCPPLSGGAWPRGVESIGLSFQSPFLHLLPLSSAKLWVTPGLRARVSSPAPFLSLVAYAESFKWNLPAGNFQVQISRPTPFPCKTLVESLSLSESQFSHLQNEDKMIFLVLCVIGSLCVS